MHLPYKLWIGVLSSLICIVHVSFGQTSPVATAEAEKGELSGGVKIAALATGYSGTGYVTNFTTSSDKVTVTMNVPSRNYYKLVIRYRAPYGTKIETMYANGSDSTSLSFTSSTTFGDLDAGNFLLNAGDNTITLRSNWGWVEIDKFSLYSVTITKNTYNITSSLINPNATQDAKTLYAYLLSNFNVKIISGQTNDWYDTIKHITGKSPLLRAFDFTAYTQGYPYSWDSKTNYFAFGGKDDGSVQKAIDWYNQTNKKGLVAFHWHWCSPSGGTVGTNTFSTANTTFDVTKAVVPGNPEYSLIIKDIDTIAYQLKRFQDAGVPVLWRPLHEAGGGWFWWGAKGPQACKKLYHILYDRLVNYHQLNNLIWEWSTPEAKWYPGNDSIDILGYDSYPGKYNYNIQRNYMDTLYHLTGGKKLIAMTENGPIPNPDDCFAFGAPWSYFMSWSDLVKAQNSTQHIIDVYNNSNVITLESAVSTGVTEITPESHSSYRIFPNPGKEEIHIEGPGYSRLELVDISGKMVFSSDSRTDVIKNRHYANGLYVLRIYNNHSVNQFKLIFCNP